MDLDQKGHVLAEYIWIDGSNGLRNKTKVSGIFHSSTLPFDHLNPRLQHRIGCLCVRRTPWWCFRLFPPGGARQRKKPARAPPRPIAPRPPTHHHDQQLHDKVMQIATRDTSSEARAAGISRYDMIEIPFCAPFDCGSMADISCSHRLWTRLQRALTTFQNGISTAHLPARPPATTRTSTSAQ